MAIHKKTDTDALKKLRQNVREDKQNQEKQKETKKSTTQSNKDTTSRTTTSSAPTSLNKSDPKAVENLREKVSQEKSTKTTPYYVFKTSPGFKTDFSSSTKTTKPKTSTVDYKTTDTYKNIEKTASQKITITSDLSDEERKKRIGEIHNELKNINITLDGIGRARTYGNSKALDKLEKETQEKKSILSAELKTLERVGTFTASEITQFAIDDAKAERAKLGYINPTARVVPSQIEAYKKQSSDIYKAEQKINTLERMQAEYKKVEKLNELNKHTEKVLSNKDFAQNSKYSPIKPKTEEELKADGYKQAKDGNWYRGLEWYTGEDSDLYTYINDPSKRLSIDSAQIAMTGKTTTSYKINGYATMTPEEIGAFNYLYHQDRKNGTKKAEEYLDKITPMLQQRAMDDEAKRYAEISKDSPVLMSGISLGTNFANALTFPAKLAATAMGVYDDIPILDMYGNRTEAIRGAVSEDMSGFGKLLYSGTMSLGDMGVAMLAGGGDAKLIQGIMSSSAGSSTISNAKENGASDGKALVLGLGSAAIEWATEKYSVEAILKKPETILGYIRTNTFTEATEEGASNLANLALDGIVSEIFGERSEIEQRIDYLVLYEGKTEEEALKIACNEKLQSLGEDVLVGGLTGAGMSSVVGGSYGIQRAIDNKGKLDTLINDEESLDMLIAQGKENGKVSAKIAEEVEKAKDDGKVTRSQVKKLIVANDTYAQEQSAKPDTLEQAARDVVEKRNKVNGIEETRKSGKVTASMLNTLSQNNVPITKEEVKKVTGFGDNGAELVAKYSNEDGATFDKVLTEVKSSYTTGFQQPDIDINNVSDAFISKAQQNAFTAGQMDGKMRMMAQKEGAKNVVVHKNAGFDSTNLPNDVAESEAKTVDLMAKALGVKSFMTSGLKGNAEINRATGEVPIDINFKREIMVDGKPQKVSLVFHAAHEMAVHRVVEVAPEEGTAFVYAMYNALAGNEPSTYTLADAKRYDYAEQGENISLAQAMEEVTANNILRLYDNDINKFHNAIDSIVNGNDTKAKQGLRKYIDYLNKMIRKILNFLSGKSAQEKANMQPQLDEITKLRDMFETAFRKAVQNANTMKNNTNSSKNLEIKINEEYNGNINHSLKENEQYTDSEYSKFGWARENNILNAGQNADYRSKFADAKVGRAKFAKSKWGEYIIPVSDIYDTLFEGINNVLVFAKGTIANPIITSVIEIYEYDETNLDRIRRKIYDCERRGIQQKTGELFTRYNASDFKFRPNQQREGSESIGNSGNNGYGERSGRETSSTTITEGLSGSKSYSLKDSNDNTIEQSINESMTMSEAKTMLEKAFVIGEIKEYYDGEYKTADEWLRGVGASEVAMYIENEYTLIEKYFNKLQGYLDGDFYVEDILDAYLEGTLVGREKPKAKRLDLGKNYRINDKRFYSPQQVKDAQKVLSVAMQRVTNENRKEVSNARAKILLFAHNKGASELLGLSQTELNKKLRTWSGYSAKARDISTRFNNGVADSNKWTGIENCSWLVKSQVTEEELESLVKEIKGSSNQYERNYIARTMLALDTHIDWTELIFDFKRGYADETRKSVRGLYDNRKRTITIGGNSGMNTVAHEMGHALDYKWHRDLFGKQTGVEHCLSENPYRLDLIEDADAQQFVKNFNIFIDSLTDVSVNYSAYTMESKETFARFVAKFVEWVEQVAGGRGFHETDYYGDKFTASQYIEFVKLLQEKAMLDSKKGENKSYSLKDTEINSVDDIKNKYADKTDHLYIYEKNNTISIDNLVVKKEYRNQGIGTDILHDIMGYADQVQKTITLTPTSEFGTKERLKKWYKQNGFVENKGRHTDFTISYTMYRLPEGVSYSLKGTNNTNYKDHQDLVNTIEHLKNEFKVTKFAKADPKKLKAMTKNLLKEYSSQAEFDDVFSSIDELYGYIANGEDGHPAVWDEVYRRAYNVSQNILDNAVAVYDELYKEYKDLREYLRSVPMKFDTKYDELPSGYESFNEFRRSNFGRLNFRKDGTSIDGVYQELSSLYPEYFDSSRETDTSAQLDKIIETLDSLQPTEYNPYSDDMKLAASFLANDIIDNFFDIPQAKPTFADKAQQRVVDARISGNKKVERVRQNRDEKIQKLMASQRAKIKKLIEKSKQSKEKAVDKEKAKRKATLDRMSETKKASVIRAKIIRHTGELNKTLLKATDKKHIPPELENAVVALLTNINMESGFEWEYGKDGLYHRVKKGTSLGAEPTKKTQAFRKLKEVYEEIAKTNDYGLTIASELYDTTGEGVGNIFDELMKLSDKKIADMTSEELTKVYDAIRLVEHSIATANKMFAMQKWEDLTQTAKAFETSIATRRPMPSVFNKRLTLDVETPITFFSHFGEAGTELYQALRDAQDNEQKMIDTLAEHIQGIVSSEQVQKAEKELFEFTTASGKKLTLSKAHIMDIYLLYNRNQGKKHLLYDPESEHFGNGIHQPEIKSKRIRRDTESTRLTKGDLGNILSKLTEEDKAIADKMQKATLLLAEWGNKACMEVFGYEKFKDHNYWTIKSAHESINQTLEKNKDLARAIKNMGSAKPIEDKATNALDIGGVFNVFNQHASDMISYSAWLGVMEDATKLYNYTFRDDDGFKTNKTFKGMLDKYAGNGGNKYYFNLLKDIQNGIGIAPDTSIEQFYTKMFGMAAKAKVAFKLTVVAQQPMAIVRATEVLNPVSIAKAIGKGGLNLPVWAASKVKNISTKDSGQLLEEWYGGWQRALKYSPIAKRKSIGGYEINSNSSGLKDVLYQPNTKKGKLIDAAKESPLWAAGKADEITWGILWNACEIETDKTTSFEKGSEAYYEDVNKLFTKVINETQVVDGVLQRSQMMRSSSGWVKPLTTFKGEPTMALNGVLRAYDNLRYETNPSKRGKAIKKFSRATTVFVMSAIFTAFARSLAVGVTGEDDEEYWKKVWKSFSGIQGDEESWFDFVKNIGLKSDAVNNVNPLSWLPVTSELMSFAQGYDVERLDVASIGDFLQAGKTFIDSLDDEGKYKTTYATRNLLFKLAELTGYSPYNLVRDIEGAIRTVRVETNDAKGLYDMEKWRTKPASNVSKYVDILHKAYTTENESYEDIYNDMIENGVDAEKIKSGMESRMKKAEGVEKASDLSKRYMAPDEEKKYDSSLSRIKKSSVWKSASTTERKEAETDLYNFLTSTTDDMEKARKEAKSHGVDATEYALWQLAISMADQPKGQKGSGSYDYKEKAEAVNSLDLGDEEIAYFFGKGLNESSREELNEVLDAGIDMKDYVNFKSAVSELKADKNAKGNSIPNSKKKKVVNYLNNANLTAEEWEFFYYEIMNYKK